jgi:hypothetical protein
VREGLARLWAEVLGIARVGAGDRFLSLGGPTLEPCAGNLVDISADVLHGPGGPCPVAEDPDARE